MVTSEATLMSIFGSRRSLQSEAALRESEQQYRNMFESAGVSIWKQDFSQVKVALEQLKAQGVRDLRQYCTAHREFVRQAASMMKIVDVNDATIKLFAAESKEDLLGSLHAVFTPETENVFVEELVAIAEGRSSFALETSLRTLKGEKLAVLFTMTFLPQPESVDSVIATIVDITERKRAESLTAQFFESSPDGVCIVERDYRYRRVNPVYARRWGVSVGMHVWEVLGMDRFERTLKPNLDRCLAGEEVIFDWSSASSPRRYFAVSYSPLRMGSEEAEAVLVIQRDITDRKETELALRDSEQRFRDYAEIASDWLWETDAEHRFTLFSRLSSSSGYAREFVGMRRWDLAVDREQEPQKWRAHIATMEAHEPFRSFRYRGVRPDGSPIYVSVSGKPVFDIDGKFLGYRGIASDLTAEVRRAQAEQALREAQAELAHVARVTTLGELTASIAHEVNQPLGAIVTNAGASLRLLESRVPDVAEAREGLKAIINDANRAADVIGRIRALTKKAPFQRQQVDLNELIREVAALTRAEMDRNRVELRFQLDADLPPIEADRIELQQLLLNLIVNAIEAMSEARTRELLIVSTKGDANDVRVSVCDSGRGLDPAATNRIFEAFYTTKAGGMGMGLAICRSIIERLGGRLWARANMPCGSIFEFAIPIEQASA
jgi:PAS domain S-box-containing protein